MKAGAAFFDDAIMPVFCPTDQPEFLIYGIHPSGPR